MIKNANRSRVALDRSYTVADDHHDLWTFKATLPYYEALETMIERRYATEHFNDRSWPLLLLGQEKDR